MYIPDHFRVDDVGVMHQFMIDNGFATLVTHKDDAPFATHVPVLLDASRGSFGTLQTHIAHANPQWRQLDGREVLVIFQGAHAYISPRWYANPMSVPTWNYEVVHAYGVARIVDDAALVDILDKTVAQYESGREKPWSVPELPPDFVEKLRRAIVGIEIEITRIEGKSKMSQNRSVDDRRGAIDGLRQAGDPLSMAVAEIVQAGLDTGQ